MRAGHSLLVPAVARHCTSTGLVLRPVSRRDDAGALGGKLQHWAARRLGVVGGGESREWAELGEGRRVERGTGSRKKDGGRLWPLPYGPYPAVDPGAG